MMPGGLMHIPGIAWQPDIGSLWLWSLSVAAVAMLGFALWRRQWVLLVRAFFCILLAILIAQPMIRFDVKRSLPDKVLIVVDDSASLKIGKRDVLAAKALERVKTLIAALGHDVEPIVLRVPQHSDNRNGDSTRIFSALRDALPGLPLSQISATVLITDGQVHDADETLGPLSRLAPFHVILTGTPDEKDRQVVVDTAPQYGLIGQPVEMTVKVQAHGEAEKTPLPLSVWQDGKQGETRMVHAGEAVRFTLKLEHPGQNVFEFKTPVVEGELTAANNSAPVIVNAVRDRLRVLLVSGVPHMGERAWRNLLKSDPGIDLVHFTILRPPGAIDPTPTDELALIVFPVDELFNSRIKDFDLIIFDKYREFHLLPPQYFDNIRRFIRDGGAFLLSMGSDRIEDSLFQTSLADTLPVVLDGETPLRGAYRPTLTDEGQRHPITAELPGADTWGKWQTQTKIRVTRGSTLMTGKDGAPLMVVDTVDKGRVGVIASDNLWLWSKGGDAGEGGPYSDLMRTLSHWLMHEPELEEGYLKAQAQGRTVTIHQRALGKDVPKVTISSPSGSEQIIDLSSPNSGWADGVFDAQEAGLYAVTNPTHKSFVLVGTAQSPEYADVITSAGPLAGVQSATQGGTVWFGKTPDFLLRRVDADARILSGDSWLGLPKRQAQTVVSTSARTLLPVPLTLLLILVSIVTVWLGEGGALTYIKKARGALKRKP